MTKINSRNYLSEVEAVPGTKSLSFSLQVGQSTWLGTVLEEKRLWDFTSKPKREGPRIRLNLNRGLDSITT